MKDHYGTLTASDIVRSIAALYQTGDAHVAVYDFDRAEMLVAYGANSIIAFAFMQLHYATLRMQRYNCCLGVDSNSVFLTCVRGRLVLGSTASPSGFGKAPLTVTKGYDRPYTKFNCTALFEWQPTEV